MPDVPATPTFLPLTLGRYLVSWQRPTDTAPVLRETLVVEVTPDAQWARVVWETVPLDQEWVHAGPLQAAVQTKLPDIPLTQPYAPPTGYSVTGQPMGVNSLYPSPTQYRKV